MYKRQGRPVAAGDATLRTVHLAGFDPDRPWLLSADIAQRPRVLLSAHPVLERLCSDYRARLAHQAADSHPREGHSFGRLSGGAILPAGLRAEFLADWLAAERDGTTPPAPATDEAAFLRWACAPADGQPGSTRWARALWRDDPDLRERFPDPFGIPDQGFRQWCEAEGVSSDRLHPAAVPVVAHAVLRRGRVRAGTAARGRAA